MEGIAKVTHRSVLGGPLLPWPTSLVHARNSGDGEDSQHYSQHFVSHPPTGRTVYRTPHACISISLGLLDEV